MNTFLIPKDELTLTEMRAYRKAAIDAGLKRAGETIGGSPDEFDVRQLANLTDLGTGVEQYRTAALAAVGTPYSVFQAVPLPATTAAELMVFYMVMCETVPMPVSLLRFRLTAAAGNLIGEFDMERMVNSLTLEGYFNRPMVIDPQTVFAVQVVCRIATGVFARVQLGAIVIERKGTNIAS